jgi:hypothetical protein
MRHWLAVLSLMVILIAVVRRRVSPVVRALVFPADTGAHRLPHRMVVRHRLGGG